VDRAEARHVLPARSTPSRRADAAKQAFVQVWNPVAARYGIERESPRDI